MLIVNSETGVYPSTKQQITYFPSVKLGAKR